MSDNTCSVWAFAQAVNPHNSTANRAPELTRADSVALGGALCHVSVHRHMEGVMAMYLDDRDDPREGTGVIGWLSLLIAGVLLTLFVWGWTS